MIILYRALGSQPILMQHGPPPFFFVRNVIMILQSRGAVMGHDAGGSHSKDTAETRSGLTARFGDRALHNKIEIKE
jgi:hypothetical protein